MKRRTFICNTSMAALTPLILGSLARCAGNKRQKGNRILVLIQLVGGNDGLNTLIPLDNYKNLAAARPNLHIPEKKILPIKGTGNAGLHPSLAGLQEMYNQGLMGAVQGVGYENTNYSHFRSSDIWLTGSGANDVIYTGWMARYLEAQLENSSPQITDVNEPHPLALKIGNTGTYLFQGTEMDLSIVIDPATTFEPLKIISEENVVTGYAVDEVKTIRNIIKQTEKYAPAIKGALKTEMQHAAHYPPKGINPLADQLKVVSNLIHGGLNTSVYLADMNGFDTHDYQADSKDSTKGLHAELLAQLSQAITCFWEDMVRMNREEDVLLMTFSEFGRRIMANGGNGTDHGSSQPVLYFGKHVNNAITGNNPVIPDKVTVYDNLELQYDYRSVFTSVLQQWLGAPADVVRSVLPGNFPQVPIVNKES